MSASRLYVLDGSAAGQSGPLHAVPTGKTTGDDDAAETPGSPAWSPDGRWLAFLVGTPSADGAVTSGALWLAGPDGQGAHQVLPKVAGFAWSPTADELAATSGVRREAVRGAAREADVPDARGARPVRRRPGLVAERARGRGRHRRPDRAKRFAGSVIDLFVPSEGIVVNSLASSRTDALIVDGWWASGEGVLAWSDPRDSASLPADGLPLVSYPLGDAPTATLPSTPAYPSFASAGRRRRDAGDRQAAPWNAKTITYCTVSGPLRAGAGRAAAPVNLDPASSQWQGEPDLAFAHCATRRPRRRRQRPGASPQALSAWYRTCRLWYAAGAGGNALAVTRAGTGVAAPTWSAADGDLLYVRDNALWLIPMRQPDGALSTAPARPVVGRLFAGSWPNADGYTAWQSQFAWHS